LLRWRSGGVKHPHDTPPFPLCRHQLSPIAPTGVQVASIFNAYGSRIQLFQSGRRILPSEDEDVSAAVSAAFRESGIVVRENFGTIESFEKTPTGVRMIFSKDGNRDSAEATLAVVAVGWWPILRR